MPRVCIHGSTQCAVEKAPTGSQLLTCYFFFFFFFFTLRKYKLSAEFGSKKYAETWEFENLIKAEMDNFDEGIRCYLSVQQAVTQMVGDGGERQLWVVTRCSH